MAQIYFTHRFISINSINVFSPSRDFNNIYFLPAYFIVRIEYIIHITCKISVNYMHDISRLLVVKLLGNEKVFTNFQLCECQAL